MKIKRSHEKEVHFETCFHCQGVRHHKLIPEYTIVSRVRYMEALVHLWEVACQKHPEMWTAKHWENVHDDPLATISSYLCNRSC